MDLDASQGSGAKSVVMEMVESMFPAKLIKLKQSAKFGFAHAIGSGETRDLIF